MELAEVRRQQDEAEDTYAATVIGFRCGNRIEKLAGDDDAHFHARPIDAGAKKLVDA